MVHLAKKKFGVKEVYVLVVIALLVGTFFGFGVSRIFKLSLPAPNTATQDVPCGTYGGFGATLSTTTAGGQYPSQPGENTVGNSIAANPYEIFQKTGIYYSWTDTGYSEPVMVAGRLLGCGLVAGTFTAVRYAFFISNDGGATWDVFGQSALGGPDGNELTYTANIGGGTFTCFPSQSQQWCIDQGAAPLTTSMFQGVPFQIHGVTYLDAKKVEKPIIDGAWLKVVIQVQANQWFDLAYDIAQLKSAMPLVKFQSQRSDSNGYAIYQVGDTAVVNYNVPATTVNGATAYYLTVLNLNTNSPIGNLANVPLTQLNGQVTFPVTPDLYVPSLSNSTSVDRLRAVIDSQIYHAQMQDIAVVDNVSQAPAMGVVQWNQAFYHEGDTVIINFTAYPNAMTHSPITKFYVLAHIGGIKLFDNFVTAKTNPDGSGYGSTTFTASNAGPLTVEVNGYDALGRPTGVGRFTEVVGPATNMCQQYPNLVECTGGGGAFKVPDYWVYAMLALLGVGVTVLLVGLYGTENKALKPALIALGVIMTLAGVAMGLLAFVNWMFWLINHVTWFRW